MVNSAYSLIEHLGKTLWASRWREGCLAVYSAYFDASGQETDKYVAVSGFIVHANTWIDWERDWLECLVRREIVNKHGDPEFHMSDCANCEYFFEGWEETREQERQHLLHDLADIISSHLSRKASCIIKVDEYIKHIDQDLREDFGMSGAYVLGGRTCAARIKEWCKKEKLPALPDVKFFFEHGDPKELQLDLRHRFLEDDYPEPLFMRKKNRYSDTGKLLDHGLVPFQASDILAYLTNQDAKFSNRRDWGKKQNIRWMHEQLSPIPEPTCNFPPDYFAGINTLLRVCKHNLL